MTTHSDTIRILYVDDDAEFAETVAGSLEAQRDRFVVETATGPDEALERLANAALDCVVSEYELSGGTGIEFLRSVREDHEEVPFVLFTAEGSERVASDALGAGATDYLPRGATPDQYGVLAERVENAVERSRSRIGYREAFEKANVGLTIRDVETGELVAVNRRYCDLLGYSREEALELDLDDVTADVPGYSAAGARELMRKATDQGGVTVEWPDETSDDNVLWVEVDVEPVRVGSRERMVVTVRSLDDDRQRERVLETLHTAATEIQACESVEAACERTVEAAERILDFEMCAILLHEDGWLVPKSTSGGAPSDGARRMADDQGLAGRTFQSGEPEIVSDAQTNSDTDPAKDTYRAGISVPVGDRGVFQAVSDERDAFGETDLELAELLVAHTARTLDRIDYETELRTQRTALRRQNERLEEFASIVTHDLRNPLNVAQGRLELIRANPEDPHLDEHIDEMERAHARMQTIIDDVLALARQGDAVTDVEPVDLAAAVRRCWATVETGNATLHVETDRTIGADGTRLQQLLENLIRNAVEHGSTGDRPVTITVGELDDGTGFFVEDDGRGIPPDRFDEVFDSGYSTNEDGTGLGLAIVREIAEGHGWDVDVAESDDGGARFEITGVDFS